MNLKYLLLVPFALAATGCAQLQSKAAAPSTPVQAPAPAPAQAKAPLPEVQIAALPKIELSQKIFFQFLLSEIARQRGKPALAAEGMLDLAKSTRDPRLAKRAAEIALQAQQEGRALEAATLWNQIEPDDPVAKQAVVAILLNSGQLEKARPLLQKLLAAEGDSVGQAMLHLNQMLSQQPDKAAVLTLVQELVEPYLNRAEAHFAISHAAWGAGKNALALSEIREASRLNPEWENAALLHGQLLLRVSMADALEFYRSLLADHPKMQEARLVYARLLVEERQYAEARTQFERLLDELPGNPDVSFAVGLLAMQTQDYDVAEKFLKQALTSHYRDDALVRMYLGQLSETRGRYEDAAGWYGSVSPRDDQYVPAQIRSAAILAKQGKLAEARSHLKQIAVQSNQQRVQVVVAEAQLLRDAKAYGEAFELLGKALEKLPNHPDLLYDHAMAAERVGKFDVLEQDLRKLIQIKPDYAHAYNALGYTLADRSERLDEALQLIEKALKLAPDDLFVLDSLGWVHYRMGQLDKAEDDLRRAYAGQRDPEIAAHLGEVLWARGKHEEAENIWRAALKENAGNESLMNVLKKFVPSN